MKQGTTKALDFNVLAFRVYIASKMNQILTGDADSLKNDSTSYPGQFPFAPIQEVLSIRTAR